MGKFLVEGVNDMTMKITVLGSYGPYPGPGGACSGYLLDSGEAKVLIDCGNGTLSRLQQVINFKDLDVIILSHLHSDHISDALILRYALGIQLIKGTTKKSMPLYAPGLPVEDFGRLQFQNAFELHKIEENLHFTYKNLKIRFMLMDHPVPCYGVEILEGNKKFVYSGDTKYCRAIVDLSKGADLFLCESGVLEIDKTASTAHLSAKEAGLIGTESKVKKMLLTHFWPEYKLDDIYNEAKDVFKGDLELAVEMKAYTI